MPSTRPTYTTDQVTQIYSRISLPHKHRKLAHNASTQAFAQSSEALRWLAALQRHTLASLPFESLALHYNPFPQISLHPEDVFSKIITQNTGRGGYCMELNALFGTLLRSLGFSVLSTGGRVNSSQASSDPAAAVSYSGWSHMQNIVTIAGDRYLVDVGFGAGGPTVPLKLGGGEEVLNIAPEQFVRLRWGCIAEHESSDAEVWILERREGAAGWREVYCFPDRVEFLPQDYEVMNLQVSTSRTSLFVRAVFCTKYIMDEEWEQVIGIIVLLGSKVHRMIRGVREDLTTCESEAERVEALVKWFGIKLNERQRMGILGTGNAINTGR